MIAGTGGDPCAKNWGAEGAAWTASAGDAWIVAMSPEGPSQTVGQGEIVGDDDGGTIGSARGMDLRRCLRREGVAYVVGDRVADALFAEPIRQRTEPSRTTELTTLTLELTTLTGTDTGAADTGAADTGAFRRPTTRGVLCRGEATERAVVGIRAVWVHPGHRRGGVATRLLDAARQGVVGGYVAGANECAFTQPTEAGRSFAMRACGDERGTFLVYE